MLRGSLSALVLLAHLSDLHLRNEADAIELGRQLDEIARRRVDHVVLTGDLLDRWDPALFAYALDLIAARGFLDPERLTLIHGNHDLASSGGHPRQRSDLWRLAARFWDPPALVAWRRRRFYAAIAARADGVAAAPPWLKTLSSGLRIAIVDSVPAPRVPFTIERRRITLSHAKGHIAADQTAWLADQRAASTLIVLLHHYPLPGSSFGWNVARGLGLRNPASSALARWHVHVPMDLDEDSRARFWDAAETAGATAVLCGHVHRARVERHRGIAIGLNGQSGADWAGRTIAFYSVDPSDRQAFDTA